MPSPTHPRTPLCHAAVLFGALVHDGLVSSITLAARVHTLDGRVLPPSPLAADMTELVDAAILGDR